MSETVELLKQAKELLSDPWRWCQTMIAKDADGNLVLEDDPNATSWCLQGACARGIEDKDDETLSTVLELLDALAVRHGGIPPMELSPSAFYNDHHSHAEVLSLLDEAIAEAERVG